MACNTILVARPCPGGFDVTDIDLAQTPRSSRIACDPSRSVGGWALM